jgi:hypothetical protein
MQIVMDNYNAISAGAVLPVKQNTGDETSVHKIFQNRFKLFGVFVFVHVNGLNLMIHDDEFSNTGDSGLPVLLR